MKKAFLIGIIGLMSVMFSCSTNSKRNTWSKEQEKEWKSKCVNLLEGGTTTRAVAEDHCDCMFDKTAKRYTPEEAAALTVEQERQIWEECDYSW